MDRIDASRPFNSNPQCQMVTSQQPPAYAHNFLYSICTYFESANTTCSIASPIHRILEVKILIEFLMSYLELQLFEI